MIHTRPEPTAQLSLPGLETASNEHSWRRPRLGVVAVLLAAAALAFLLPFGTVSCNEETVRFSGIELATRHVAPHPAAAHAPDKGLAGDVETDGSFYALAALVCCVFGVGSAALRGRGGGFALAAALSLLVLLLDAGMSDAEVSIEIGFWLAFGATAAAVALRWRSRRATKRARAAAGLPQAQRRWRQRAPSIALSVGALALVLVVDEVNMRDPTGGAGSGDVDFVTSDWSPDGRWIAFTSNRGKGGVFRVRADGSCLVRIASGWEPAWSPDGRRLAVLQEGKGKSGSELLEMARLVIVGRNGEKPRVLAEGPFTNPQWSRDGTQIYVERATGEFTTAGFAVSLATGKPTRLAPQWVRPKDRRWSIAAVSETGPAVSPDGTRYVFESSDDPTVGIDELGEKLFVREVGKPGRVRLTDPAQAGDWEPAWSADGLRVAFQRSGEIAVVDADGSDVRVLTSVDGATEPAWSPDGRSIVFSRELYGGGYGDSAAALEVVDVATGAVRKLTWGPGIPACA